jgi:hypothetical protein
LDFAVIPMRLNVLTYSVNVVINEVVKAITGLCNLLSISC